MNTSIKLCHPETTEILINAHTAYYENKEITKEQYNEIVFSCFLAEEEWRPQDELIQVDEQPSDHE